MSLDKIVEMNDYITRYKVNFNDVEAVNKLVNVIKQAFANCHIYNKFNQNLIKVKKFKAKHINL